jgi:peptidyl-prolyl cis-trans isomerase D
MLQLIRSKATSFVVKILFGLLIVTFGIWGVGDIFRDRGGPEATVATVGSRSVTADELNQAVQNDMERLRGALGGSLDAQQAKQLGIVDQALQRLINSDLVELEINRLGLAIGDQATRDAIVGNAQFHDPSGQFDRNIYAQALAANHMTEAQFETLMRGDLLRAQLVESLTSGMTPPQPLVDALYRARAERRVADTVTVPPSAAGTIAAPSEEQIAEYYHAHEDHFRTPERRSFTVATLLAADVAAGIDVSEDDLKTQYASRSDEFHTPAQRHLEQMLLPDEATAKEAQTALAAGKDFAAVAKDVAKSDDPATLDLGWVGEKDLPPELGAPAFALPVGGTTPPIKSTFGWHILRVVEERPATVQTFDQVKDKLKTEIANERAGDRTADIANQIDDAIAGGGTFDDVAKKFALKTVPVTDADADGKLPDGKQATLPEPREPILHTVFATDSGQTSALAELGDDGYYLVRVDKVSPAATQSLADVHDAAAAAWQDQARQAAVQKIADQMAADVNGGKSLKDVAAEHHLTVTPTPALLRTGGDDKVPPALVAKLFDAKQGAAVAEPTADGVMVAQLTTVVPADPAKDQTTVQQLTQQLGGALAGDLADEYQQALRRNYPVSVDQSSVDRLF